ncbi:hypothetical protein COCCADRAFT_99995, partial [Bipolaris zeicola 26-R-13]
HRTSNAKPLGSRSSHLRIFSRSSKTDAYTVHRQVPISIHQKQSMAGVQAISDRYVVSITDGLF